MGKALLAVALVAGMVGFATLSEAQTKKDPPPKKIEAPAAALGKVEIFKGKAGMRWRIVDTDGKTIAMPVASKHWETKEEVVKALEELKDTIDKVKPVEVKE